MRLLDALILVSPAILSWIGTNVVVASIDHDLKPIKSEIQSLTSENDYLTFFTRSFGANELGRGSLLLMMNATGADEKLRYLADRFYRTNADSIGSLRRVTAIVRPQDWQQVMKPYEELVTTNYDRPEQIATLQDTENGIIADALAKIVANQKVVNALSLQTDGFEASKGFWTSTFQYLALVMTVFVFFYKQRS